MFFFFKSSLPVKYIIPAFTSIVKVGTDEKEIIMVAIVAETKLRMLSLCSGIGGADLAAEATGAIEIVGQVEIDPFCQAVLAKHWPNVARMNDIKEVAGHEFGKIDIVMGGIPCQPFSGAGKQYGKDDNRHLWPQMFSIIKSCQPTWVIIENVDDFTYMALDDVSADLESEKYAVQAFVLPACAVNAPHERKRCFVVAYSNGIRESREKGSLTNWERGTIESASLCQWKNSQKNMAYPHSKRRKELNVTNISGEQRQHCRNVSTFRQSGQLESGIRRDAYGVPTWLHSHKWPTLPNEEQKEDEPPRTIIKKSAYINQRLKALGNAIVPQQIKPLFDAIVDMECVAW